MQHVYQPFLIERDGDNLRITPRYTFANIDEYDITTDTVTIGSERLLNVYVRLKEDKPWAKKGFAVASEQFVLQPYLFESSLGGKPAMVQKTAKGLVAHTNHGTITVNSLGALTSWIIDGEEMLNSPLKPYFWKPENDNQHAAHFAERLVAWRDALDKRTNKSFRAEAASDGVKIISETTLPIGAELTITYTITDEGRVKVDMDYRPTATNLPLLPKFGMRMRLPNDYANVAYHGRGPWENYPDRKRSAFIGKYEMPLSQFETEYIHPQDNGCRTDVRWFNISNGKKSIRIDGCQPLCIRAWDYGEEDLEPAQHPHEIQRGRFVNLNIDLNIHGVGGIDTWGQRTLPQYTIDGNKPYHYTFIMSAL